MSANVELIDKHLINELFYPQVFLLSDKGITTGPYEAPLYYKSLRAWATDIYGLDNDAQVNAISDKIHILTGIGRSCDHISVRDSNINVDDINSAVKTEFHKQLKFAMAMRKSGMDITVTDQKYGYYLMAVVRKCVIP